MNITARVRVLNFFRNVFRNSFLEKGLANLTLNKNPQHFFSRFVPNAYQYAPGSIRKVQRYGLVLLADVSDYVGHFLYFGFRDVAQDNLFELCKPGYNIVDVGTNIGWTVLNFGRLSGAGKIIGFEPDPFNYEVCKKNLSFNNLSNIELLPIGLGDREAEVRLEVRTPGNRGGNRVSPNSNNNSVPIQIKMLDSIDAVTSLSKVDLIKLDVEGYELHVLRGARGILTQHKPILFIEVDDRNLKDQGDSAAALILFLEQMGYSTIKHAETNQPITRNFEFADCHFDIIALA